MNLVLDKFKEIANAVLYAAEASDFEEVLHRIAAVGRELVECQYAALGVPDGKGGLRYFKTVGILPEDIARMDHLPRGGGLIGAIMEERRPINLVDMSSDPRASGFPMHHPRMERFLGVPIMLGQQLFGMFYLCDRKDGLPFDEKDQLLIETLAGYAALTIASADMNQQRNRLRLLEERERIGMELHDGIIQSLYGIGMQVDLLRLEGSANSTELQAIIDNLNEVIEDIRKYILKLRTMNGPRRSMHDCLDHIKQRLHIPKKIEVHIDAPNEPAPFSAAVFESICLIVNEAFSNAVRHADAKRIDLIAFEESGQYKIMVCDDGRGFDLSSVANQSGLGLRNMQQRARLYGGQVMIDSALGSGTTLTIAIPVKAY